MTKLDGNENVADIGTKSLPGKRINHLLHHVDFAGEGLGGLEQKAVGALEGRRQKLPGRKGQRDRGRGRASGAYRPDE